MKYTGGTQLKQAIPSCSASPVGELSLSPTHSPTSATRRATRLETTEQGAKLVAKLHADIGRFLENEHTNNWTPRDRGLWKEYIRMTFTLLPSAEDRQSHSPSEDRLRDVPSDEDVTEMLKATCDLHHASRSYSSLLHHS